MHKTPTAKQEKAIENIRQGKMPTQAMRDAGYSESSARTPARLFRSENVQKRFKALGIAYDEIEVDAKYIAEQTKEMMEATEVKIVGNGEEAFAEEVPDWKARAKAHELWRRDMQVWSPPKEQGGNTTITQNNVTQNNVTISREKAEKINEILNEELKE